VPVPLAKGKKKMEKGGAGEERSETLKRKGDPGTNTKTKKGKKGGCSGKNGMGGEGTNKKKKKRKEMADKPWEKKQGEIRVPAKRNRKEKRGKGNIRLPG